MYRSQLLKQTGHTRTRAHTHTQCNRTQCKNQFSRTRYPFVQGSHVTVQPEIGRARGRRWLRYCTGVNVNNKASSARALQETKEQLLCTKMPLKQHFLLKPLYQRGLSSYRALWRCCSPSVLGGAQEALVGQPQGPGLSHHPTHEPPAWRRDNCPQAKTSDARGLVASSPRHWPRRTQGPRRAACTCPSSPFPFLPSRSEPPDLQGLHNSAREPPSPTPSACSQASQRKTTVVLDQSRGQGDRKAPPCRGLCPFAALPS